ncbi:hypothetical protein HYT54_02105 [Candidatus Woesearchaeota archaeon]|nr:hypothetical protein [Candidatus Woesearchaeota archaeon]
MKSIYWNKDTEREAGKSGKSLLIAISAFVVLLIAGYATAAPNQITVQGKLTNTAGAALGSTTVNLTFKIYDSFTNGIELWMYQQNITTDANGVYDIILKNLNLTFADQYYMGVTIGSDNESAPRINLTSSPYSFRANISEDLNQNNSYIIRNLSVTGNATIGSDGLSTIRINTISLNVTLAHLNYSGSLGIDSNSYFLGNLGIGKIIPASRLDIVGDVSIAGPLNASSLNVTGNAYLAINMGNVGIGTTSPATKFNVVGTAGITEFQVESNGAVKILSNNNVQPLFIVNGTGTADLVNIIDDSTKVFTILDGGNVGINTTTPSELLEIFGNIKLSTSSPIINISGAIIRKSGNDIVVTD